ncbi:hypothetical protein V8E54_006295 [Elaphomyces granulatus]
MSIDQATAREKAAIAKPQPRSAGQPTRPTRDQQVQELMHFLHTTKAPLEEPGPQDGSLFSIKTRPRILRQLAQPKDRRSKESTSPVSNSFAATRPKAGTPLGGGDRILDWSRSESSRQASSAAGLQPEFSGLTALVQYSLSFPDDNDVCPPPYRQSEPALRSPLPQAKRTGTHHLGDGNHAQGLVILSGNTPAPPQSSTKSGEDLNGPGPSIYTQRHQARNGDSVREAGRFKAEVEIKRQHESSSNTEHHKDESKTLAVPGRETESAPPNIRAMTESNPKPNSKDTLQRQQLALDSSAIAAASLSSDSSRKNSDEDKKASTKATADPTSLALANTHNARSVSLWPATDQKGRHTPQPPTQLRPCPPRPAPLSLNVSYNDHIPVSRSLQNSTPSSPISPISPSFPASPATISLPLHGSPARSITLSIASAPTPRAVNMPRDDKDGQRIPSLIRSLTSGVTPSTPPPTKPLPSLPMLGTGERRPPEGIECLKRIISLESETLAESSSQKQDDASREESQCSQYQSSVSRASISSISTEMRTRLLTDVTPFPAGSTGNDLQRLQLRIERVHSLRKRHIEEMQTQRKLERGGSISQGEDVTADPLKGDKTQEQKQPQQSTEPEPIGSSDKIKTGGVPQKGSPVSPVPTFPLPTDPPVARHLVLAPSQKPAGLTISSPRASNISTPRSDRPPEPETRASNTRRGKRKVSSLKYGGGIGYHRRFESPSLPSSDEDGLGTHLPSARATRRGADRKRNGIGGVHDSQVSPSDLMRRKHSSQCSQCSGNNTLQIMHYLRYLEDRIAFFERMNKSLERQNMHLVRALRSSLGTKIPYLDGDCTSPRSLASSPWCNTITPPSSAERDDPHPNGLTPTSYKHHNSSGDSWVRIPKQDFHCSIETMSSLNESCRALEEIIMMDGCDLRSLPGWRAG